MVRTKVCGYVRGYVFGSQDAFNTYSSPNETLSGNYVDGVSITYSSPPRTYVAGLNEISTSKNFQLECLCNTNNTGNSPS